MIDIFLWTQNVWLKLWLIGCKQNIRYWSITSDWCLCFTRGYSEKLPPATSKCWYFLLCQPHFWRPANVQMSFNFPQYLIWCPSVGLNFGTYKVLVQLKTFHRMLLSSNLDQLFSWMPIQVLRQSPYRDESAINQPDYSSTPICHKSLLLALSGTLHRLIHRKLLAPWVHTTWTLVCLLLLPNYSLVWTDTWLWNPPPIFIDCLH